MFVQWLPQLRLVYHSRALFQIYIIDLLSIKENKILGLCWGVNTPNESKLTIASQKVAEIFFIMCLLNVRLLQIQPLFIYHVLD